MQKQEKARRKKGFLPDLSIIERLERAHALMDQPTGNKERAFRRFQGLLRWAIKKARTTRELYDLTETGCCAQPFLSTDRQTPLSRKYWQKLTLLSIEEQKVLA